MSSPVTGKAAAQKPHAFPAIDNFKLLAAFLVIAIHTSPLTSFHPEADFVLTRILGRVAVPFFFMVTGYFVLPKALEQRSCRLRYLKRIALCYLGSSLLYLPISLYAGHFQGKDLFFFLKLLFFDGTFYHLWYLPAALTGFILVWLMLKNLSLERSLFVSAALYLIGLFGDSYYGLIAQGKFLLPFYHNLFRLFSYTRNGFLMAPVFLLLGYSLSGQKNEAPFKASEVSGDLKRLLLSLCLLIAEGLVLHRLKWQRHDSMYVSLLPVLYFLFRFLLKWNTPNIFTLLSLPGELPLLLYLLHPLFLILLRGFAHITGWTVLTDNSLLHFSAVALASFVGSWGLALIRSHILTVYQRRKQV